ncbi:MAG: squalene--hopene cyclase [Verrucomicrobiae bacterium]|nr:squalene--hopene cyclase [Verrucomicrobiae bacterium]
MTAALRERAEGVLDRLCRVLVGELGQRDHWVGELSGSALSTAVATIALGEIDRRTGRTGHAGLVENGLRWLADHVHADGGWGDTLRSRSNLSTTALGWAAFGAAGADARYPAVIRAAHGWLERAAGGLDGLVPAIEGRYGKDRTFSVPIVLTLALSGRLGAGGWRRVRPLPFELASLPRSWFGALQLPVVSYALPALIALGQAIHHHAPSRWLPVRWLRQAAVNGTLRRLEGLQPENGGFLEATPLTAFVTLSLASMDRPDHPVARRAAEFLRASVRADGSWPIDTNLATWVSTLSVKALPALGDWLPEARRERLRAWLLGQQYRREHPYTGAAPGGWAWTDLPGGVPDADDTAGALVALHRLGADDRATREAAERGVGWLLDLQNRDGGIPTFCRGWGALPFDRSAPELTAHALRAWGCWEGCLGPAMAARVARARRRALRYLVRSQREDGAWLPLWFGNEHAPGDANPVYGTSQVLTVLGSGREQGEGVAGMVQRGRAFLVAAQGGDGGWGGAPGGPSTIEETALAVRALSGLGEGRGEVERGMAWLVGRLAGDAMPEASPIGLYFARLWYWERLYPVIFAVDALRCGLAGPGTPERPGFSGDQGGRVRV